ncbi:preprotein translocase subunit SecF [Haladaptatus paucihalophilus DX253]|uniref:Protein-export membrane protein SecF n=1 Tax=Haladaptatus paucihalophilus DX253 TaxID=797209 RepID=E7QZY7_HALPU|nr:MULTISPECIES: protein translocase subunit SecF [Haladaptatus]EFW89881.1 preprotein translocase subunit SecF [Haladaptatus paucihalophilus DX253]GKZ12898.1 preprotein translocase subunit SecF [Haladaptatus sp. T7]SHK56983.1 protein translocase subunit secF [Haladaptatus paucihalophilus DX253]
MVEFQVPEVDYTRYSNRQLAGVPLAILVLALLVIAGWYAATGAPVTPGIDFTGGTEMRIQTTASQQQITTSFDSEVASVTPAQSSNNVYIVTFQDTDTNSLTSQAEDLGYDVLSIQSTSASFGSSAQQLALYGIVAAFVGMSIIVFLMFRSFVPSIAVVLSAFSDIVIPVALMNLFGIKLSLGTVAALLMLIGYSVDSDILLNNHVLRRSGGFYESTYRAMRTGVTMTVTSLAAMAVMTIVAFIFQIGLLTAIGVVLVMGLATDLMNTYMLNLSLLRWYKYEGVGR